MTNELAEAPAVVTGRALPCERGLAGEDRWMTRPELATRWKMPKSTLNQWAAQHKGPRYAMFGRHARYRPSDVIAWETEQFVHVPQAPGGQR